MSARRRVKSRLCGKDNGKKRMLILKQRPVNAKLGDTQFNQLFRYFTVTEARRQSSQMGERLVFSAPTNRNKMIKRPFFKFDFQILIVLKWMRLARFQKNRTSPSDEIVEGGFETLKYTRALQRIIYVSSGRSSRGLFRVVDASNSMMAQHENITEQICARVKPLEELNP